MKIYLRLDYPWHKKQIILFGEKIDIEKVLNIKHTCEKYDVEVLFL